MLPLVVLIIVGIYLLTYVLDKKTEAPKNVKKISKCSVCHMVNCPLSGTDAKKPLDDCKLNEMHH
jgi:hypothetical protein